MRRIFKNLGETGDDAPVRKFTGKSSLDYSLYFWNQDGLDRLDVDLGDGHNSLFATPLIDLSSPTVSFGGGSTDIWLSGQTAWSGVDIDGGYGDHSIMVDRVGEQGADVRLGYGSSAIKLGTLADDTLTVVRADEGQHRVKADGLASVQLGYGDHLVDVGQVGSVVVGYGNSQILFETAAAGTTITAGYGDHTIIDTSLQHSGGALTIRFQEANTKRGTTIDVGEAQGATILGGYGNHTIDAGEAGLVRLDYGRQTVLFSDGADDVGARIQTVSGKDFVVGDLSGGNVRTNIKTGAGSDTVVLLGGDWRLDSTSSANGGGGKDKLYLSSFTREDDQSGDPKLNVSGFEKIIWIDSSSTIDNIIVLDGRNGAATGEVLDFSDVNPNHDLTTGAATTGLDLAQPTFDLVPTPDPESPGAVELVAVDYPYGAPVADPDEAATREDRLRESSDDFLLRIDTYELSFSTLEVESLYSVVRYNEFGDYCGTNADDVMIDTQGDSQIFSMGGDDEVDGGGGDDHIYTGKGDDVLRGGDGQDLLDGGAGYDILIGGSDIDIFVFRKGEGTTEIADFEMSVDVLDVEGFENLTYEKLTQAGTQIDDDVYYYLGEDTLILRDAELATMQEIDLCLK